MSTNYLDSNGLLYLWGKIKDRFVAKETNKGLSSNDYTDAEKAKLLNIESGAEVNVQADWNQTVTTADDYIKNKPTIPEEVSPSSTTPAMNGTASVGTEIAFARGDHVHPSDTSRVPTSRTVNGHALSSNVTVTNTDLGQGYAISSTDKSVTAKTATLSGYVLTTGGVVAVKFTFDTGDGIYTLNVNSKGAKAIVYNGTAATSSAPIKLPFCRRTGVTYYFMYNGSNYVYIGSDQESIYFGSCSTSSVTAAKTADCVGFTGLADCLVLISFGQGNTVTPITLNVNGLGDKQVLFPQDSGAANTNASKFKGFGYYMFEYTYNGGILGAFKYVGSLGSSYDVATTSADGLMSAADKTKLNNLVFDSDNRISSSILPSYVDDVIEAYPIEGATPLSAGWLSDTYSSVSNIDINQPLSETEVAGDPLTPESGKIYILMWDTEDYTANTQFRWGGSTYVMLSDSSGISSITNAEIDTIVAT